MNPPQGTPEDAPRRENEYLGAEPAPTDLGELIKELGEFLTVAELQVGSMNLFPREGFLNEQALVYQSRLLRCIVKALRQRNTRFFRDLAKALANTDHPALINQTARQFRQIASALSSTGDPNVDSPLEKLRNTEWLARSTPKKIRALESKLLRRLNVKGKTLEKSVEAEFQHPGRPKEKKLIKVQKTVYSTDTSQKTQPPFQPDVVKHWEMRTGKSRYEINVPREMRAAKLELPKGKRGRPRRKKHAGNRIK